MVNENSAHKAKENMDQEVNEDSAQETNGKHVDNGPNKYDEILIELNSVNTKHMECPLQTQENPCLIYELLHTIKVD